MLKKLLVFIFIFSAQSLFAYNCKIYADRAKKHALTANALGCDNNGDRWDLSWQPHYNWCASVELTTAKAEDNIRTKLLIKCVINHIYLTTCESYAYRAVRQYAANYHLGCGFTGDNWHSNYVPHLNWCYGVNLHVINDEDTARRNALGWCIGRR